MKKLLSESDVISVIAAAIEHTVGKTPFSAESFFKRDLNFSSIDLIDFFFELEKLIGENINVRQLLLTLGSQQKSGDDLQVQQLAHYLCHPGPKQ